MTSKEVAQAFTQLCKEGKFDDAGKRFWSEDVVSREPMEGEMAMVKGRTAVEKKGEWWYANHEVHSAKTEGPYVHGDQFAVRFAFEITPKGGQRMSMDEVALYTVKNGKIVEERFFFNG
jgi:ketosteroid isomerase-like protein